MQTKSDAELLQEYVTTQSEAAFQEIVRRYTDFVFSAALRQVGSPEQARDIAQIVFTQLARKADSLGKNVILIGWLCQSARLASLEQRRKDRRRSERERLSMDLLHSSGEPDDWSAVRPVLDEAIASLPEDDRHALLLRYFKSESLASVGAALGISEDAAQKRVSRSVAKLREFLANRGISTTSAALSEGLLANGVHAAPVGLAGSLAAGALARLALPAHPTSLASLFKSANVKTGIMMLAAAAGLVWMTISKVKAERELQDSKAVVARQNLEIESLHGANAKALALSNQVEQLKDDARDVLRLRAEVTKLKQAQLIKGLTTARDSETNEAMAELKPQDINISARIIWVPQPFRNKLTQVFNPTQVRSLVKEYEQQALSAARDRLQAIDQGEITTPRERQSQLLLHVAGDTIGRPLVGLAIDVLPGLETNVSGTVRMESVFGTLLYFTGRTNQWGSPMVDDQLNLFMITNSFAIQDGDSLVLTRNIPSEWMNTKFPDFPASKGIVIQLTPALVDNNGNRRFGGTNILSNTMTNIGQRNLIIGIGPDKQPRLMEVSSPPQ